MAELEANIASLQDGGTLLKCGRSGKPHFRPFKLTKDRKRLAYSTPKKKEGMEYVILREVTEIKYGQHTANFKKSPLPDYAHLSFSLIYGDRTLDLVCSDEIQFRLWFSTLSALTVNRDYHAFLLEAKGNRRKASGDEGSGGGSSRGKGARKELASRRSRMSGRGAGTLKMHFKGAKAILELATDSLDVLSWGNNTHGQLGLGKGKEQNRDQSKPRLIESLLAKDIVSIACGPNHSLVINREGAVFAFGLGSSGQLGLGDNRGRAVPTRIETTLKGKTIVEAAAGKDHSVLLTDDSRVYSCGADGEGQLGHGDSGESQFTPRLIEALSGKGIIAVGANYNSSMALSMKGLLYVWGSCEPGHLGVGGNPKSIPTPQQVKDIPGGAKIVDVALGPFHMLAVTDGGAVLACGEGTGGRLGLGKDSGNKNTLTVVEDLTTEQISSVAAGNDHSVALTQTGAVFTWGANGYGETGYGGEGEPDVVPTPRRLPPEMLGGAADSSATWIGAGASHTAVVMEDGDLWTFGYGSRGCLGHGEESDELRPRRVDALDGKKVHSVVAGGNVTLASVIHAWVPDSEADVCMNCGDAFTLLNRRHHCRNCGGLFCAKCSTNRAVLLGLGSTDPQRVCDKCTTDLTSIRAKERKNLATLIGSESAKTHTNKFGLSGTDHAFSTNAPSGKLTSTAGTLVSPGSSRAPPGGGGRSSTGSSRRRKGGGVSWRKKKSPSKSDK